MMEINVHSPLGGGCEVEVLDSGSGVATGGSRPTPSGTPPGTPSGTPPGWISIKAVDSGSQCETILMVDLNTTDHWLQNPYFHFAGIQTMEGHLYTIVQCLTNKQHINQL